MNDGINRIPPGLPPTYGVKPTTAIQREKQEHHDVQDHVSVNPDAIKQPEPEKEEISLSLETIRLIAKGNLDPDIEAALTAFALLGDLSDAERLCDIIEGRGIMFLDWLPGKSLHQTLVDAAS